MQLDDVLHQCHSNFPVLGIPGALDLRKGREGCAVTAAPKDPMALSAIRERLSKTGGLSHFEVIRTPFWRRRNQMQVLAKDRTGIQEVEIAVVDWLTDEECEAWVSRWAD